MLEPVVKWPGSKRRYVPTLRTLILDFDRLIEPFAGSASVSRAYPYSVRVCGDFDRNLINLWKAIVERPKDITNTYEDYYSGFKESEEFYYNIRDKFNEKRNPEDFYFLLRTCTSGIVRYNSDGEFNVSVHHKTEGMNPSTVRKIVNRCSHNMSNVDFYCGDFESISNVGEGDFVFMDPPYYNTASLYSGTIDPDRLSSFMERIDSRGAKFIITLGSPEPEEVGIWYPFEDSEVLVSSRSGIWNVSDATDHESSDPNEYAYSNYEYRRQKDPLSF